MALNEIDRRQHQAFRFLHISLRDLLARLFPRWFPRPAAALPPAKGRAAPSPEPGPETLADPILLWIPARHALGVPSLDEDHRHLATLINQVYFAVVRNHGRSEAFELMDQLLLEARQHFLKEEAALREAGYPVLEAHLAEHERLLQEAASLSRQFHDGRISGISFPAYLKKWLLDHIETSDRPFAAWLRSRSGPLGEQNPPPRIPTGKEA